MYCERVEDVVGCVEEPPRHAFKRTLAAGRLGTGTGVEVEDLREYPILDTTGKHCECQGAKQNGLSAADEEKQVKKLVLCLNNLQRALDLLPEMRQVAMDKCQETGTCHVYVDSC